jgi:uncharacterized membrane protein
MNDLELTLGRLLGIGVMISSLALGAGLATALTIGAGAASTFLLTAGVLLLLATPIARVVVSSVVYARRRDWLFVVLTAIVLAELIASIVAAVRGNRA